MRREALIDAMCDLITTEGLQGATPRAAAQRAGLSRSSAYQYFPSSQDLLGSGVVRLFERARADLEVAVRKITDPVEQIHTIVHTTLKAGREAHERIPSLMGLDLPPQYVAEIRAQHRTFLAPLETAVAQAGAQNPEILAGLIDGLLHGGGRLVRGGKSVSAVTEHIMACIKGGLVASVS